MISLSKTISSLIEKGKRILKVDEFGVKTVNECSPFGDDANPLPKMSAIFANTSEVGEPVVIGYINANQLAGIGEKRIFSLQEDGTVSTFIWLKNDQTIEIGGNTQNLVRFDPLNSGIENKDTLVNQELAKIALAIGNLGGSYSPGTINTNIEAAKINEIKTL